MVISRRSRLKVYHQEWCPYAKKIGDKYRRNVTPDTARSRGYHECSWCCGPHGLYMDMRDHPEGFYGRILETTSISWDSKNKGICFRTANGFWKAIWKPKEQGFKLWHLNKCDWDPELSDKELMKKSFHRQIDVDVTKKIGTIMKYIYEHDKASKIMENDWKKLPRSTKKQRIYYKKKKKKEKWKAVRRVDELFKQLEAEKKEKHYA